MADWLVRVTVYVSEVIGRQFEKVRNGHRFENWMPIWEFEFTRGHGFEDWTSNRGWTSIWVYCGNNWNRYFLKSGIRWKTSIISVNYMWITFSLQICHAKSVKQENLMHNSYIVKYIQRCSELCWRMQITIFIKSVITMIEKNLL
jgi:hypothetical protein